MIEDRARYHGYNVGRGIGFVFAFSYMAVRAADGALTWGQATAGVLYGVTAAAVTYVVIYLFYNVVPGLVGLSVNRPMAGETAVTPHSAPSPMQPAAPPLRETRYLEIGTTSYLVPDTIIAAIEAVQEERLNGNLRTVSANALHDMGLADRRNGQAEQIINFLLKIGAVVSTGDRRPYEWTEAGEIAFPLPHTFQATGRAARLSATGRGSRGAVAATGGDWGRGDDEEYEVYE
jgi:hypothetical protein